MASQKLSGGSIWKIFTRRGEIKVELKNDIFLHKPTTEGSGYHTEIQKEIMKEHEWYYECYDDNKDEKVIGAWDEINEIYSCVSMLWIIKAGNEYFLLVDTMSVIGVYEYRMFVEKE